MLKGSCGGIGLDALDPASELVGVLGDQVAQDEAVVVADVRVAWAQAQQKLGASKKWQKWIDDLQGWRKSTVTSSSMLVEVTP